MYWFLLFLMAAKPPLWLLGYFGLFGKEGERAAEDLVPVFAGVAIILVVVILAWLGLSAFGVV